MRFRTAATLSSSLGRFRVPILTFLVGVGFVVPGSGVSVDAPRSFADVASLSIAEGGGDPRIVQAAGMAGLLIPDRGAVTRRGPAKRFTGSAGPDERPGSDLGASRSAGLSHTVGRSRSASSATARALASSHFRALARAGRLSAPSTAPPVARS